MVLHSRLRYVMEIFKVNKKLTRYLITIGIIIVAASLFVTSVIVAQKISGNVSKEITVEEAQTIIDAKFSSLPNSVATVAKYIVENTSVTVNDINYGSEKDIILSCTYTTRDVKSTVSENIDEYILTAYNFNMKNEAEGKKTNATKVKLLIAESMLEDFNSSENITGDVTLYIYEIQENVFELYLSDETVNTVFGGLLEAKEIIKNTLTVNVDGEEISIATKNTLRTGINDCLSLNNYDSRKPDTAIGIIKAWNTFKYDFHRNFIVNNQWTYITNGLLTTLKITALAVLIGIAIGFIVAVIRCTNQKTGKLSFLNGICRLYISIMRGTPVMVQLLIMYFVILLPIGVEKFPAAVICFGLNSGAYVSEIVRGGIMSIDAGQTEAGRSLGFTYMQTMWYIIIPQAFKAVLPSLANEFITLLKESSVAFYIGVADLTLGGLRIRSITYSNYMPLIAVALIYLILVLGLSKCVSILERRLRKSDNR